MPPGMPPAPALPTQPRPGHTHIPCQGDASKHGPALLGLRPHPGHTPGPLLTTPRALTQATLLSQPAPQDNLKPAPS